MTLHGTVVAGPDRGLLIVGASGSGKSALALDLMGPMVELVADDRVILAVRDGALIASSPARLRGLIECRDVGLIAVPARDCASLRLVVDLDRVPCGRMPPPHVWEHSGIALPCLAGRGLTSLPSLLRLWLLGLAELESQKG